MTRPGILPRLGLLSLGLPCALSASFGSACAEDLVVRVRDAGGLRRAVASAKPATRILLEPGEYSGGFHFAVLRGEEGKPIVLGAADPKQPPVILGGATGLHLTAPEHVELRDLVIRGSTQNGINIDDGGSVDTPARDVLLSGLSITEIGTGGNNDGIKLSGVQGFRVERCRIERWGSGGGSGIDMVGCHRGVIEGCLLRHTEEKSSSGVQAKGGSSDIVIRASRFERAGGRAINIGGSTGLEYFRPPLSPEPGAERCEAKEIRVEGNTFLGAGAPIAFVGVDGAVVRFNTIYRPRRWAVRILQETREPGFVPTRKGVFTDNIVVFRLDEWSTAVNVGTGTEPGSFQIARNWWYALDRPERSRPDLPVKEDGGQYGKDPWLVDPEAGDLRLRPGSPAGAAGVEGLAR